MNHIFGTAEMSQWPFDEDKNWRKTEVCIVVEPFSEMNIVPPFLYVPEVNRSLLRMLLELII